ncbi:hypothetical protein C8N24_0744 [Solirubrobacter pauli]|uniref:Uncharacterized protein n=1 Tax=Solirubrobacter pauli TaxID=166793 RepID=A0A660L8T1_9ACTN|nr:hypothetical protein C8N24_0744 [Solirubrobacter pauli]
MPVAGRLSRRGAMGCPRRSPVDRRIVLSRARHRRRYRGVKLVELAADGVPPLLVSRGNIVGKERSRGRIMVQRQASTRAFDAIDLVERPRATERARVQVDQPEPRDDLALRFARSRTTESDVQSRVAEEQVRNPRSDNCGLRLRVLGYLSHYLARVSNAGHPTSKYHLPVPCDLRAGRYAEHYPACLVALDGIVTLEYAAWREDSAGVPPGRPVRCRPAGFPAEESHVVSLSSIGLRAAEAAGGVVNALTCHKRLSSHCGINVARLRC